MCVCEGPQHTSASWTISHSQDERGIRRDYRGDRLRDFGRCRVADCEVLPVRRCDLRCGGCDALPSASKKAAIPRALVLKRQWSKVLCDLRDHCPYQRKHDSDAYGSAGTITLHANHSALVISPEMRRQSRSRQGQAKGFSDCGLELREQACAFVTDVLHPYDVIGFTGRDCAADIHCTTGGASLVVGNAHDFQGSQVLGHHGLL